MLHTSEGAAMAMTDALPHRDEDTALAIRAKTEREAFGMLFDRWLPKIYGYIYRRIGHRETAEDLASRAFEKAYGAIRSFDAKKGSWSSWMYRIATNVLYDHYRSAKDVVLLEEDAAEALPSKEDLNLLVDRGFDAVRVRAAMEGMPERYKSAIALRFFEERTTEEMMEILEVKRGTLAVLMHRSLRALGRRLVERPDA
ncbi:sigma-70 family RNA polymerase sigma factor [Patescibacteria group bacterium]|nr:MAG: sigma-70 family RNA polymerase sigma factor [Patescibacteria group bacterium]